jgi:hypothetical protein
MFEIRFVLVFEPKNFEQVEAADITGGFWNTVCCVVRQRWEMVEMRYRRAI